MVVVMVPPMTVLVEQVVVVVLVVDLVDPQNQVVRDKISLDQRNKATLVVMDLLVKLEQETVVEVVVPVLLDKIALLGPTPSGHGGVGLQVLMKRTRSIRCCWCSWTWRRGWMVCWWRWRKLLS